MNENPEEIRVFLDSVTNTNLAKARDIFRNSFKTLQGEDWMVTLRESLEKELPDVLFKIEVEDDLLRVTYEPATPIIEVKLLMVLEPYMITT